MKQQESFLKLNLLGQEAERLEQQIQAIDQQILELNSVSGSIEEISKKTDEKTEILANLGKGVFLKTELKSKELLVNVGKDILLKKTPEETRTIIEEQLEKLASGREKILKQIEKLQESMQKILGEVKEEQTKKPKDTE